MLAALDLGGEQRRRAVDGARVLAEVEAGRLQDVGPQQQPVLVEWAAGDADRLAPEVGGTADRRGGRRDQRALGRRIGQELHGLALGLEPRRKQDVGDDRVDRTAEEGDARRVARGDQHVLDLDADRLVEAVRGDRRQHPMAGAEGQRADLDRGGRVRPRPARSERRRSERPRTGDHRTSGKRHYARGESSHRRKHSRAGRGGKRPVGRKRAQP